MCHTDLIKQARQRGLMLVQLSAQRWLVIYRGPDALSITEHVSVLFNYLDTSAENWLEVKGGVLRNKPR